MLTRVVQESCGGLPDFDDFTLIHAMTYKWTLDTLERLREAQ